MKNYEITKDEKLPFGIGCIDSFLHGGIDRGVITQVYGEGGSGKTNLAMQLTISTLLSGTNVIYIDTEGFSSDRFMQISDGNKEISKHLILYRPENYGEQEVNLIKAERLMQSSKDIGLLVIDSLTALLRIERDENIKSQGLSKIISLLNTISNRYGIPVFTTNQIYFDVNAGNITPFGGYLLDHFSKTIISLRRVQPGSRIMTIEKHRSIKEGETQIFYIGPTGISCFQ